MLFFNDFKDSSIDLLSVKLRNKFICIRCEWICCLNPHEIIFWAAAFPPTVWTGGFMPDHAFNYVIENIEPEKVQAWLMEISEILCVFTVKEPLQQSNSYSVFLKGQSLLYMKRRNDVSDK